MEIAKHAKRVAARYVENTPRIKDGVVDPKSWDEYEARLFDNLFARTGLVAPVRSFTPNPYKLTRPKELTIACISAPLRLASSDRNGLRSVRFRDGCRLVQLDDVNEARHWIAARERELEAALELKPDIVCFSELAYPPPPPEPDSGWNVDCIKEYASRRIGFEESVRNKLRQADSRAFVFLGSFHCLMTLYNVGVLFPWGPSSDGVTLKVMHEWLDNDREEAPTKVFPPITLKKRFPARRAGEVTRTPPEPSFDVFETEFGRIAVLICSDILDLNQFINVARWNEPSEKFFGIDVVLVPSFNKSQKLLSMCRELSYLASTTVICNNANPREDDYPDTELFCCGLSSGELRKVSELKQVVSAARYTGVKAGGTGARLHKYKMRWPHVSGLRESTQKLLADPSRPGLRRASLSVTRARIE